MKNIDKELIRVEELRKGSGADFFGNKHKLDREWWVLGRTFKLLMQNGDCDYFSALPATPPLPDFQIMNSDGELSKYVEIGECIEEGRRRHDEIKNRLAHPNPRGYSIHVIDDPFISFRKVVNQKFGKPYAPGSWLIILFSIMGLQMPDYYSKLWSQMIFEEVDSWSGDEGSPSMDRCPFDRVLVLDSGGKSLVSIFPRLEVIFEHKANS
ncbi:MAG: hypothetical protein RLZZ505_1069 [Verrucomicrobiota bacterium]|jgi:hypothetical protein